MPVFVRTKGGFLLLAILAFGSAVMLVSGYALFTKPNYERLNFPQRYMVRSVVAKWEKQVEDPLTGKGPLVDYDYLLEGLNIFEKTVVERIFASNPRGLGFKGPFHSWEKPKSLVKIPPRTYKQNGEEKSTKNQYCPEVSYTDYLKMMAQMRRDLGRDLLIESGYRSPGMQAYLFLYCLVRKHQYSMQQTARLVAFPGYSEHNDPVNNALDFINTDGINGDDPGQTPEEFEGLPEYQWLLQHAHKFNFYLSYPRDNQLGVSFEPWHWHWERSRSHPATNTK